MTDKLTTLLAGLAVTISLGVFSHMVNRVSALEQKEADHELLVQSQRLDYPLKPDIIRIEDKIDKRFDRLEQKLDAILTK